ncbi:type II toxin-antitoxin system RelE/ParE family toxin [Asticcacaulis sp. YBE204]|uniref:type II toxin-antitoxin system RelE/ParE family toxin n=1 Tax=Asticcacaulis sp. YBE204 TaxID=1282363 RepID=UPI0009DD5CB7
MRIVIEAEARSEINDAVTWYRSGSVETALRLEEEIASSIGRIAERPTLYRRSDRDLRICRMSQFPYKIIYRAEADEIRIVAFFHTRRDPSIWQSRS